MERGPVFIGGAERSGTSLLYALLTSHPNISLTRRTNLWAYFNNQYGDLGRPENLERCLAALMRYNRFLVLKPDPEEIRQEFWKGQPSYGRLFEIIWKQFARRTGKSRWGDKSLNSERFADEIFRAFPNARILQIIRDPRDRYASALKRWKTIRGRAGSGTAIWLTSVRLGERNCQRYPGQYRIIRYETLAAQPEETLREVCAFIGEEYSPAMLAMEGAENFREEGGNSSYGQRDPGQISTSSIGRFRKMLKQQDIAFMQALAGREMLRYDYPLVPVQLPVKERLLFRLVDLPLNFARLKAWQIREDYWDRKGREIPPYRIVPETRAVQMKGAP
jgi:hypothetical protein